VLGTHRLRVLQQVARSGSLAGAARSLSYTQPAVAHHIGELEREVGTPLIVRHGRGVRLTEAGTALAAHADAVLARLSAAEDEVAAIAGLHAGRVRVAAYPTAAATLVPRALVALRADYPGIAVSLDEVEPPEALAALRSGDADLAVTFRYPDEPGGTDADRDLVTTPLGDDPVDIVVPAGHRSAGAAAGHHLVDLAGETWVAGCDRCRAHLVRSCRRAGFEPEVAFTTTTTSPSRRWSRPGWRSPPCPARRSAPTPTRGCGPAPARTWATGRSRWSWRATRCPRPSQPFGTASCGGPDGLTLTPRFLPRNLG
jgi:DNA-binding transcriptional LysR family regulator